MSAVLPQFAGLPNVIVDVSHHNGRINFEALKAGGIRGVIQKATQGQTGTDPTYETNKSAALDVDLLWAPIISEPAAMVYDRPIIFSTWSGIRVRRYWCWTLNQIQLGRA